MNPDCGSRVASLLKGVSSGFGYLAFAGLSSMAAAARLEATRRWRRRPRTSRPGPSE